MSAPRKRHAAPGLAARVIDKSDASLLDLVDHVLSKGVVLEGEVLLGVAGVDLVYLRLAAVLCAADRVLAAAPAAASTRRASRGRAAPRVPRGGRAR